MDFGLEDKINNTILGTPISELEAKANQLLEDIKTELQGATTECATFYLPSELY